MASSTQALFYCLWQDPTIHDRLVEFLSRQDLCAVRVTNSACCNLVTKRLFVRINVTFTANTFTRPSRIQALTRIAHHIEHLSFNFPHSNATFLPPLIHPQTGQEIMFLYNPHTSMESALTRPKYGNSELGEILTQQYPPLFHAASNVPSFINAIKHLTNIRHLTIKTPGQEPSERYRRDIVDYALISLRIAVERSSLTKLSKLTLSGVHPAAFNYLRHKSGFGTIPSAALRWQQIKKLYISVESWDFYGPSPGLDHLKIIDDYIRDFAPQLEKFAFTWLGRRGPCPIALAGDPLFGSPRGSRKLFNEVTSPMSPLPPTPARSQLIMHRLRCMSVRNATMNAPQLKELIISHRDTVREFDFENVALVRGGSWEEALAPLTSDGSETWSRKSVHSEGSGSIRPGTPRSNSSGAVSGDDENIPTPSPAAEAASRELFEVDLEGIVFGGVNDVDAFEAGVEEWAMGVTADLSNGKSGPDAAANLADGYDSGLASDLEAARQATEGFSTKLLKRRRKRRSHAREDEEEDSKNRSRTHKTIVDHFKSSSKLDLKSERSRSRNKHTRSADDHKTSRSRSPPGHRSRRHHHHRKHHTDDHHHQHHHHAIPSLPSMPSMPEVIGTDDEYHFQHNIKKPSLHALQQHPSTPPRSRPSTPPKSPRQLFAAAFRPLTPPSTPPFRSLNPSSPKPSCSRFQSQAQQQQQQPQSRTQSSQLKISIPLHPPSSFPVMLQPTVYDPSSHSGPFMPSSPPRADTADLSPTQRSIEEEIKREEAELAAARSSALKRAREAVMTKLSKQYGKHNNNANEHGNNHGNGGYYNNTTTAAAGGAAATKGYGAESAAVRMAGREMELGMGSMNNNNNNHNGHTGGSGPSLGARIREGLFGRSAKDVNNVGGGSGGVGGYGNTHHHGGGYGGSGSNSNSSSSGTVGNVGGYGYASGNGIGSVVSDGRRVTTESGSQSVLVPLIFSRI